MVTVVRLLHSRRASRWHLMLSTSSVMEAGERLRHSSPQHSTAQHSTAQHSTAHHAQSTRVALP